MAQVLCVGNVTLDIINKVESYPPEDSEVRALDQVQGMGGNAANTARVLSRLGCKTEWLGNLSEQGQVDIIKQEFARCDVTFEHAIHCNAGTFPTSYISLNKKNGSRSIVHYRDMPEYSADDFSQLNLYAFDWIHFEGRAVDQLKAMMLRARNACGLPISLEVEKKRAGIEELFPIADVIFFSHDYVRSKGFNEAADFLSSLPKGTIASVTWGEHGAWGIDDSHKIHHVQSQLSHAVVDTIGAGDVFNAAMIHALSIGQSFYEALCAAVALSGEHCAKEGFA